MTSARYRLQWDPLTIAGVRKDAQNVRPGSDRDSGSVPERPLWTLLRILLHATVDPDTIEPLQVTVTLDPPLHDVGVLCPHVWQVYWDPGHEYTVQELERYTHARIWVDHYDRTEIEKILHTVPNGYQVSFRHHGPNGCHSKRWILLTDGTYVQIPL